MKRLIIVCLCTILVGICATNALADHWVRDGVFEPGYCVACAVTSDGQPFCVNAIALGTPEEAEEACGILNDEPMTTPENIPIWFKWDATERTLVKMKFPCRYIPGDVM